MREVINVKLEIDGKAIELPGGATIIEAANRLGIYVPHFCWHKKLSIAANCRMCLVQVEKAPKPLPACSTPVTEGMKVFTHSAQAVQAQQGVMEFLLINHPLDCPICDQGGECQLQDLAVGYGASASRYSEPKRVVEPKDIGPLVAAKEMTRCIQCTRCVRFGQEIAGVMELGMAGRGEHAEILAFVGRTVDSELSGNMIDLCPVGALTSEPFRYTARSWELTRFRSVSPHCGLGSNLVVQVKQDRVMRVLPFENDAVNECWLSDKDRFSYVGLNAADRLVAPLLRRDGQWQIVDWPVALAAIAQGFRQACEQHGPQAFGALASPHSTLEELYLLGKLARGLGSGNVDFRLRQADFSGDPGQAIAGPPCAPWLGVAVEALNTLDGVLIVGSQLRKDHPLLAARVRRAARKGAQVSRVDCLRDDWLMPLCAELTVAPSQLPAALAQVLRAAARLKQVALPDPLETLFPREETSGQAQAIAASLLEAVHGAVFLGNLAQHHPQAALLHRLAFELAQLTGAGLGFLGEAANSVGGYIAGAVPFYQIGGLDAREMLVKPRRAYVVLHAELELDCHNPRQALKAMHEADFVVALSSFAHRAVEYADVLLPVAPFTETAGAFVSTEGRLQSFSGVVKPLGETRPAWKVLRVLGNLLGLPGFEFDSAEEVRGEVLSGAPIEGRLSNAPMDVRHLPAVAPRFRFQRIGDVPIHFADPLVRRSVPLQQTRDAEPPAARLSPVSIKRLGLREGEVVRVTQEGGEAVVAVQSDATVPDDCVCLAAAHPATAGLGDLFGAVEIARVTAAEPEPA